jgi:coproporphyrinogen III oxidase-like Fe-S oxidoreductase
MASKRASGNLGARFFDNISIDLLFGTPHTTFADWQENLATSP